MLPKLSNESVAKGARREGRIRQSHEIGRKNESERVLVKITTLKGRHCHSQ
jgi:hypothetical protein